MSFLDYGSRIGNSLGRYGRDIDTFKSSVLEDKFSNIEKMFSPEISQTATQLTNLNNIKDTVDNALGGTASGLESVGSAVGVKKLYGAIKEKLGGKTLADKKENNEITEENTGERTDMEKAFGTEAEQNEIPDWLKPAFKNSGASEEGTTNSLEDLFGKVKNTLNDVKGQVQDKMGEIQGQVQDKIQEVRGNIQDKVGELRDNVQGKMNELRGAPKEGEPSEIEMTEMRPRTDMEKAFGTEAEQNEPASWLDDIDTSLRKGAGQLASEDETETLGKTLLSRGLGRPSQAGSGNINSTSKVEGMTNEAPTQVETAENISGDASKVSSGLEDTEDALKTVSAVADAGEAVEEGASVASSFLDAIPVVGAVLGIGLQVGTAIFSGVEQGQEQSLEAKEASEQAQEKSAEQQAQDKIRQFGNTSFSGSTVVPTFSSLQGMNMGGGSGVF